MNFLIFTQNSCPTSSWLLKSIKVFVINQFIIFMPATYKLSVHLVWSAWSLPYTLYSHHSVRACRFFCSLGWWEICLTPFTRSQFGNETAVENREVAPCFFKQLRNLPPFTILHPSSYLSVLLDRCCGTLLSIESSLKK